MKRPIFALVLASALLLSACTGETDLSVGSAPTQTEEAVIDSSWGLEWTRVEFPTPTADEGIFWNYFGAGDRLWAYAGDQGFTLYSTEGDGEWQMHDLRSPVLPQGLLDGRVPEPRIVASDARGDEVTIAFDFDPSTPGWELSGVLWKRMGIVHVVDEETTVNLGSEIGLETLPGPEQGQIFRTIEAVTFVTVAGARHLVGTGLWYAPGTGDRSDDIRSWANPGQDDNADAFIATESPDGTWSVYSALVEPLGGQENLSVIVDAVAFADELVIFAAGPGHAYPVETWTSTDAREFSVHTSHPEGAGESFAMTDVVAGEDRLVAVGLDGPTEELKDGFVAGRVTASNSRPVALWSHDGRNWNLARLGEPGEKVFRIEAVPGGFIAFGETAVADGLAWTSPDGENWTRHADTIPFAARAPLRIGDGLVAPFDGGAYVSGNDW